MHILLLYIGIFFGVIFEGEMVMISAVIAAHHGYLNLWIVAIISFAGIYSADIFYFKIGQKKGKEWLDKHPKFKTKTSLIDRKIERYPTLIFIMYRFLIGFRTVTPIVIGTGYTKTGTFLLLSATCVFIWVSTYTTIGYIFGEIIKSELGHIEHIEKYIIGFILLAGITILMVKKLKRKNKE